MRPDLEKRITIDPKIMLGKPVISGTRIPVYMIVRMVAEEIPFSEILREYPRLTNEDIQAALHYAASTIEDEDIYPVLVTG